MIILKNLDVGYFNIKCKKCGYEDALNKFNIDLGDWVGEIECPTCGYKEEI